MFKFNNWWQVNVDDLCLEIVWYVDLCWCVGVFGLKDYLVQNFCDMGWVVYFFLIGDYIFEKCYLFDFLEFVLIKCFVGGLWCYQ